MRCYKRVVQTAAPLRDRPAGVVSSAIRAFCLRIPHSAYGSPFRLAAPSRRQHGAGNSASARRWACRQLRTARALPSPRSSIHSRLTSRSYVAREADPQETLMRTAECGSVVRRLSLAVILIFAIAASSALAQTADRPTVKVGDEWQFVEYFGVPPSKPTQSWVVTSITPAEIVGTENGKPLLLTADLNIVESPRYKHSDFRMLNFPLAVGKKWSCSTNAYNFIEQTPFTVEYNVTVVALERVRVPAGEFDAFKLQANGRVGVNAPPGPGAMEETRMYWYAPEARAIVKEEVRNPYRGSFNVELVTYKLQP